MENIIQKNKVVISEQSQALTTPNPDLSGYDLVLSMTNDAINHHLEEHHSDCHIPNEINIEDPTTKASIRSKLKAPRIEFKVDEGNPAPKWYISLVMIFEKGGCFVDKEGNKYKFDKDEKVAFFVDLEKNHIEDPSHIDEMRLHKEVKDKLKSIEPEDFRVIRLFTQLKDGPINDYIDDRHTSLKAELSEKAFKTFCTLLHQFLKELTIDHKTPFHIGFIPLQKKNATIEKDTSPFNFTPTGLKTSVSVAFDDKNKEHLVLNYLMVTNHRAFPEHNLLYHVKGIVFGDAYLRFAQESFVEDFFLKELQRAHQLGRYFFTTSGNGYNYWLIAGPRHKKSLYEKDISPKTKVKIQEEEQNEGGLLFSEHEGKSLKIESIALLNRRMELKFDSLSNQVLLLKRYTTNNWDLKVKDGTLDELELKHTGSLIKDEFFDRTRLNISTFIKNGWVDFAAHCLTFLHNVDEYPGRRPERFPRHSISANSTVKIPTKGEFTIEKIAMILLKIPNSRLLVCNPCLSLKIDYKSQMKEEKLSKE